RSITEVTSKPISSMASNATVPPAMKNCKASEDERHLRLSRGKKLVEELRSRSRPIATVTPVCLPVGAYHPRRSAPGERLLREIVPSEATGADLARRGREPGFP